MKNRENRESSRVSEQMNKSVAQHFIDHVEWLDSEGKRGRQFVSMPIVLSGFNFEDYNISKANFSNLCLEGASLGHRKSLTGIKFIDTKLNKSSLKNTSLFDCDLRLADVSGSEIENVVFWRCNFSKALLNEIEASNSIRFVLCKLKNASFIKAQLNEAVFDTVNLERANFTNAHLNGARFLHSDLGFTRAYQANFREADLSNADLSNTDCSEANFIDANLKGANLTNTNLTRANLNRVDFSETRIDEANFRQADLRRATFNRKDRQMADFGGADLAGVNWVD